MLGMAAIANARLAWAAHVESLDTERWATLADQGAHPQRPLWASTGVKDPAYDPTRYVVDLVVRGVRQHHAGGDAAGRGGAGADPRRLRDGHGGRRRRAPGPIWPLWGSTTAEVCALLEREGVGKFIDSWEQLRATVATAAGDVRS